MAEIAGALDRAETDLSRMDETIGEVALLVASVTRATDSHFEAEQRLHVMERRQTLKRRARLG